MSSERPRPLRLTSLEGLGVAAGPDSPGAALLSPRTPGASALKGLNNPLASKVTSVLSASYADADFRDSLALLDERHVQNNAETRRRLRLDVQKEVINSNGGVIAEFGRVAEVSCPEKSRERQLADTDGDSNSAASAAPSKSSTGRTTA